MPTRRLPSARSALVVRNKVADGAVGVVERPAARLDVSGQNAPWSIASYSRWLRIWRVSTAYFLPDATMMGDVPA